MMRSAIFGFFGLLAVQAPAVAAPSAACDAVGNDWRTAAFSSPAKPAQARVAGSAGYQASGAEYRQMMQAIRHVCESQDQTVAVRQAAVAEGLLHHAKGGL
ncbi:MAG: hypothetical protein JWO51_4420 [Rhodospirillales bacterium]|nr:hypothetical protein [Rhodospirillales bacterium]